MSAWEGGKGRVGCGGALCSCAQPGGRAARHTAPGRAMPRHTKHVCMCTQAQQQRTGRQFSCLNTHLYTCLNAHLYTCLNTHPYTCLNTHRYTCLYMCKSTLISAHRSGVQHHLSPGTHTSTRERAHARMHAHTHTHVRVHRFGAECRYNQADVRFRLVHARRDAQC